MTAKARHQAMITGLLLLMLSGYSGAQVFPGGNGLSLSGLRQFDLHIQIAGWQDMAVDAVDFRLLTQREFESRLKSAGIRRQPASRDYLVCKIRALRTDDALVAYTVTLEYWGLRSTDVHTLLWENGALGTAAAADFDAARVAADCADTFVHEWSRWNPAT